MLYFIASTIHVTARSNRIKLTAPTDILPASNRSGSFFKVRVIFADPLGAGV